MAGVAARLMRAGGTRGTPLPAPGPLDQNVCIPSPAVIMPPVSVRYIVHDVDEAIAFYTNCLGFTVALHPAPAFAMLDRGDLRLLLSAPNAQGGGGSAMPDGTKPEPGGWNRISLQVPDLPALVAELRGKGARFRNDIVKGVGGDQILVNDPSGNCVELFEPHGRSA